MKLRLLPLFLVIALSLSTRVSDVIDRWPDFSAPSTAGIAQAAEEGDGEQTAADQTAEAESEPTDEEIVDQSLSEDTGDIFGQEFFSDSEIELLQDLRQRREELAEREKELDRRQAALAVTERQIEQKIEEMDQLRTEIKGLLDEQQSVQEERMARLVKIYENMKPKDAARIFNELDLPVLMEMLDRMSERKTAPILAEMDANRARIISSQLAQDKKLPDNNFSNRYYN
jgi:flagellar motility protein MotE (MotC chaperone)